MELLSPGILAQLMGFGTLLLHDGFYPITSINVTPNPRENGFLSEGL